MRDLVGRQADRFDTMDLDRTLAHTGQAHDGAQRRGAPGTIAAQQRDDFTRLHYEIDVMQDMRLAIPCLQVGDFQSGHRH